MNERNASNPPRPQQSVPQSSETQTTSSFQPVDLSSREAASSGLTTTLQSHSLTARVTTRSHNTATTVAGVEASAVATSSSTGSSLPNSYESSFASFGVSARGLQSPSNFFDSGYDSVGSPHILNLLATERDEELGTMFPMSIEDLPGQCESEENNVGVGSPNNVSTPLRRYGGVVSPGLPIFDGSPPPGTFRPLSPAGPITPVRGGHVAPVTTHSVVSMSRREWRTVSTQTPPGARSRSSRVRPRSAPLYEEREDSASDERDGEEDEMDDGSVFVTCPTSTTVSRVDPIIGTDQVDGEATLRPPLPDLLPERRMRSASVPALSRIYEQQVGEQLRELGDSIFRERLVGPRSLPNADPFGLSTSNLLSRQRRNSVTQSFWDLLYRLVNMAQGPNSSN